MSLGETISIIRWEGFLLFQTVAKQTVLLNEHFRTRDKAVNSVLDRIAEGRATGEDIDLLRKHTLGHPNGPDVSDGRWRDAILVTPTNVVRHAWNN